MKPRITYVNSRLQAENKVKKIEDNGGIAWIEAVGLDGTFVPGNGALYGLSVRYFTPYTIKKAAQRKGQ